MMVLKVFKGSAEEITAAVMLAFAALLPLELLPTRNRGAMREEVVMDAAALAATSHIIPESLHDASITITARITEDHRFVVDLVALKPGREMPEIISVNLSIDQVRAWGLQKCDGMEERAAFEEWCVEQNLTTLLHTIEYELGWYQVSRRPAQALAELQIK